MMLFDGTCCPGEDGQKGEGHKDTCFGPISNLGWNNYWTFGCVCRYNQTFTMFKEISSIRRQTLVRTWRAVANDLSRLGSQPEMF